MAIKPTLLFLFAILAICVNAQRISDVTYAGNDCTFGLVLPPLISLDAQTVVISLDAFHASIGMEFSMPGASTCNFGLTLALPDGKTAVNVSLSYSGIIRLDDGLSAIHSTIWNGTDVSERRIVNGPTFQNYVFHEAKEFTDLVTVDNQVTVLFHVTLLVEPTSNVAIAQPTATPTPVAAATRQNTKQRRWPHQSIIQTQEGIINAEEIVLRIARS
eukprot:TRINITY_DN210_c0_g1_i1.p1 TRINITY_DN210_c0_g1~~TRINITY_DN210_c0_g1_i1.p1  ORF type:complete len:216 (-),score=25.31 TRINITY_DN210_c0_g1_i1:90-737(-)